MRGRMRFNLRSNPIVVDINTDFEAIKPFELFDYRNDVLYMLESERSLTTNKVFIYDVRVHNHDSNADVDVFMLLEGEIKIRRAVRYNDPLCPKFFLYPVEVVEE